MKPFTVTFHPDDVKVRVGPHNTIMDAAQKAGVIINSDCGGAGTCKKCLVEIADQKEPVLACQYIIKQNLIVTLGDNAKFFEQKILEQGITLEEKINPMVCKHHLVLEKPARKDLKNVTQLLIEAIEKQTSETTCPGAEQGKYSINASVQAQLPRKLDQYHYHVTAVCREQHIIALEKADTTKTLLGVSVDVGTTTVVAHLVDLLSGKDLAVASRTNPQVRFGDDIISRIRFTETQDEGLKHLQQCIIDCINELIERLCQKSSARPKHIYELTAAGNCVMQHLLLGAPVAQLAQAPYVTSFLGPVNAPASELGVKIHPQGNIYVMPSVASQVGGDTVAVALATGMNHSKKCNLALDIGTNGELILGNKNRLTACSTAAGPAFEGARIRHGMRAAAGAIERVTINKNVEISVIDGGPPRGICGSGLIDAVAELLKVGLIDKSGRMLSINEFTDKCPDARFCPSTNPALGERLSQVDGEPAFVLVPAEQTKQGRAIILSQRDIRQVQLAKAAIRAGMTILMNQLQIKWADIDRIYLAGAFGNYIRPAGACRIGLLPNVEKTRILPVGNAAGAGVRQVLLSRSARRLAEKLAQEIEYVELAGLTRFEQLFSEHISFPEV